MISNLAGFFTPWIIYSAITLLHFTIPGKWVQGYARHPKTGHVLKYKLNGITVFILSLLTWYSLGYLGLVELDWLYRVRWYSLAGACAFGILFTALIVLPFPSTGRPLLLDIFLGRLENPQYGSGRLDAKMWLYLAGAVMLELNVLSFTAHHLILFGSEASWGLILCAAMLTFFVLDYMIFEKVHLYTYDFIAERVGFKLGWGCLAFYPFFYPIAIWSTAHLQGTNESELVLIAATILFLAGWTLARGANLQKYYFKTDSDRSFLGLKPQCISDGNYALLTNGFWGVSRHINYLGEILMATGIALSVSGQGSFWPLLYPVYYIALLLPRQVDDDRRCAAKYGELWSRYVKQVKYRIIPYLY